MRELNQYEVDEVTGARIGSLVRKVINYFKSKPVETGVVVGTGAAGVVDGVTSCPASGGDG